MDCVRVASKHGEGGAAQHTQAWQHMQQSCRTRVCSLCSSVPVLLAQNRILWRSGRVHHTERSSQVNGSHAITSVSHSSSSISSSQSHRSSSQSPHSLRPNPAEGLASRSCAAGLSQGHPHVARYHATTCQQLPTP